MDFFKTLTFRQKQILLIFFGLFISIKKNCSLTLIDDKIKEIKLMMLTEQKINSIRDIIVSRYDPAAIYVFGSYAAGSATEQSDLDLLIINQSLIPNDKLGVEISKSLFPRDYSLDILVFSREEIKRKIESDYSFWKNILKNGKKIYERE